MLIRTICLLAIMLAMPARAAAAGYVVQPGDSLARIAQHFHLSVSSLARMNGIRNVNLIRIGQVLRVSNTTGYAAGHVLYHVRWGDSLTAIAAHYGTTVAALRALNPSIGEYLLAGQWIKVGGSAPGSTTGYSTAGVSVSTRHTVHPGETLSGIAASYGVSISSLMTANGISNPDLVQFGATLIVPGASSTPAGVYDPWTARSLIVSDASVFGLESALPLAVGWDESGFNQTLVSSTGAVGVMQVEPFTATHISRLLGRRIDIYNVTDNVYAGVYWLSVLVRYYGGNERLAVAAYYQGARSLARIGMYTDTRQYVATVMALKARFGG